MDLPQGFPPIPEERIALIPYIDRTKLKKTHEDILRNFNIFEIYKKNTCDIEQKLSEIITSQNKDLPNVPKYSACAKYPLDLQRGLHDLEYFYKIEDLDNILFITTYIITYYKNILTTTDYITLLLKQSIAYRKNNMIHISNKTLQQLTSYEKYFTNDDKVLYYLIIGNNLSQQGLACDKKDQDIIKRYFFEAYQAFNTLLMQESLFENDFYKKLMFKMAICTYKTHNIKECLRMLTEIQNIPDDSKDTPLTSHILLLRGLAYEEFHQYQKEIDTFQKYLLYVPNDKVIQDRIKILSKQFSK